MEHCHICNEAIRLDGPVVWVTVQNVDEPQWYPLCPVHGVQLSDYLVTMLQGWLHDRPRKRTRDSVGYASETQYVEEKRKEKS